MTKIINLFGPPGTGKSTVASLVFGLLKLNLQNVELVVEYAKELTWEQQTDKLKQPLQIYAEQKTRMDRLLGKVDYIITDSPLLLVLAYYNKPADGFTNMVSNDFRSYDNCSYYLKRVKPYNPAGRNETEEEANMLGITIEKILIDSGQPYRTMFASFDTPEVIVEQLIGECRHEISDRLSN